MSLKYKLKYKLFNTRSPVNLLNLQYNFGKSKKLLESEYHVRSFWIADEMIKEILQTKVPIAETFSFI